MHLLTQISIGDIFTEAMVLLAVAVCLREQLSARRDSKAAGKVTRAAR